MRRFAKTAAFAVGEFWASVPVRRFRIRPFPRAVCAADRDGRGRREADAVADEQDIDGFHMFREPELFADGFGFEHADPERVEPQRRCGQHHVVGDDRSVDVADRFTVVFAGPCFAGVGADDDGAGSAEVAGAACQTLHPLLRAYDDEPLGLAVGARRSHAARLQNDVELFLLDFCRGIFAACVPLFCQREKIHSGNCLKSDKYTAKFPPRQLFTAAFVMPA